MMEDNITKTKIHTERRTSEIAVIVRLWQLTLKCQYLMKYNSAK